jgi:hypothetical protein
MDGTRFEQAIRLFDEANRQDVRMEAHEGALYPKELLYAMRMTDRLLRFNPDASEALRLAARSQHIQRWTIPRDCYPEGQAGYMAWRRELAGFHAEKAGNILRQVGYEEAMIRRIQALIRKERLKTDTETQTLEDVACLVFLESYLADFKNKHAPEKVADILEKSLAKMSPAGRDAARALLEAGG